MKKTIVPFFLILASYLFIQRLPTPSARVISSDSPGKKVVRLVAVNAPGYSGLLEYLLEEFNQTSGVLTTT